MPIFYGRDCNDIVGQNEKQNLKESLDDSTTFKSEFSYGHSRKTLPRVLFPKRFHGTRCSVFIDFSGVRPKKKVMGYPGSSWTRRQHDSTRCEFRTSIMTGYEMRRHHRHIIRAMTLYRFSIYSNGKVRLLPIFIVRGEGCRRDCNDTVEINEK